MKKGLAVSVFITLIVISVFATAITGCSSTDDVENPLFEMTKYKADTPNWIHSLQITDFHRWRINDEVSESAYERAKSELGERWDLSSLPFTEFDFDDIIIVSEEYHEEGEGLLILKGYFDIYHAQLLENGLDHPTDYIRGHQLWPNGEYWLMFFNDLIVWSDSMEMLGEFIDVIDDETPTLFDNRAAKEIAQYIDSDAIVIHWAKETANNESLDGLVLMALTGAIRNNGGAFMKIILYFKDEFSANQIEINDFNDKDEEEPFWGKIEYANNIVIVTTSYSDDSLETIDQPGNSITELHNVELAVVSLMADPDNPICTLDGSDPRIKSIVKCGPDPANPLSLTQDMTDGGLIEICTSVECVGDGDAPSSLTDYISFEFSEYYYCVNEDGSVRGYRKDCLLDSGINCEDVRIIRP